MTIFGWDASDYDHGRGPMNMAAARRDGIDFYTHKATEGTSVKHHPGPSLANARDAGIPFLGCYMVPRTGPSVALQVAYLLSWVDQQAPWWRAFPGWFWQMDTEHWAYDKVSPEIGHQCAVELARRTGKRVLHYAPRWAYGNTVPQDEPLWASSYVTGAGGYLSLYPGDGSSRWGAYSGRTPVILQYTSSARIGSQPSCDANAFRGTVADFAKLIGAGPVSGSGGGVDAGITIKGDTMFMIRKDGEAQVKVYDDHGNLRWSIDEESERDWLHKGGMALYDGCSPELYAALTTPPKSTSVPIDVELSVEQLNTLALALAGKVAGTLSNGSFSVTIAPAEPTN